MSVIEPTPDVHTFSSGYYLVDGMFVTPSETTDVPIVQDHLYGLWQREIYEQRSVPMLFRHNETGNHFQIRPSESVRIDTIEMPFEMVDAMNLSRFPNDEQFLMAKPRHAHNLQQMSQTNPSIIDR